MRNLQSANGQGANPQNFLNSKEFIERLFNFEKCIMSEAKAKEIRDEQDASIEGSNDIASEMSYQEFLKTLDDE